MQKVEQQTFDFAELEKDTSKEFAERLKDIIDLKDIVKFNVETLASGTKLYSFFAVDSFDNNFVIITAMFYPEKIFSIDKIHSFAFRDLGLNVQF